MIAITATLAAIGAASIPMSALVSMITVLQARAGPAPRAGARACLGPFAAHVALCGTVDGFFV